MRLEPDTLSRAALGDASGFSLSGDPDTASVEYASGADAAEVEPGEDGTFEIPIRAVPDLLTVSWEDHGAKVSARVMAVSRRYSSPDAVRSYRESSYKLGDVGDDAIRDAIDRAENVVERCSRRRYQPVVEPGTVRAPGPSGSSLVETQVGSASDVARVTREDGSEIPTDGCACWPDPRTAPPVERVTVEHGMRLTPPGVSEAVTALAAWYLVPSGVPDNAVSESTDAGVLRFVVGGVDGAETSLPEVNALISRYGLSDWRIS